MHQSSTTGSTLPTHTVQLSDDVILQQYYCGCGLLFEDQNTFKTHTVQKHKGRYVLDSSHYVNHVNLNVMKCQHWDPSIFKVAKYKIVKVQNQSKNTQPVQQKPGTSKDQHNIKKEKKTQRKIESSLNKVDQNESKFCDTQDQFDQTPCKLKEEAQAKRQKLLRGRSCFQHEKYNFKTQEQQLVQKASASNEDLDEETISIACKQNNLENCVSPKMSSMEISSLIKQEANMNQKLYQNSITNLFTITSVQNKPETVKLFSGNKSIQVPTYMLKVFVFLSRQSMIIERTKSRTFHCGCGKVIKNGNKHGDALHHILLTHKQIVPRNSSHIFLSRYISNKVIYRMLNKDDNENPGWYCPCRPGVDMTKKQLFKHVMYVHKGISPAYILPLFWNSSKNKKTEKYI